MSAIAEPLSCYPRGPALALAALGPVAIGAIMAVRAETASPLLVVPAVVFGVVAATTPKITAGTMNRGAAVSLRIARIAPIATGPRAASARAGPRGE